MKKEFLLVTVLFFSTNSMLFSRIRKHRIVIQLIELWTVALRIKKDWQENSDSPFWMTSGTVWNRDTWVSRWQKKNQVSGVVCSPSLTFTSSLDGETGWGIFRPSPDTNQFTTLWNNNPSVRSAPHTVQTYHEQPPKCCFAKKEALSSTWMLLDSPRGLAFSIQRDPTERFRRRRQNCGADNTKHFTKNISSNKVTVSAVKLGFSGFIYFYPESCGRTWLTVPRAQHQGAVWPAEGRSALSRSPHWNRASKGASWTSAAYLTRWFVSLVCV